MQVSQEAVETRIRFNDLVAFRGPNGLMRAVATAARREHTTSAEFLRRLVIAHLREVGVPIVPADQDQRAA
jgi:hypothetical protein